MTPADWPLYRYKAKFKRLVDGDTFVAQVLLGMDVAIDIQVRVAGYDAPERRGPTKAAGDRSAAHLESLIAPHTLYLATQKDDRSFVRWVARVYVPGADGRLADVADLMIAAGHGTPMAAAGTGLPTATTLPGRGDSAQMEILDSPGPIDP